MDDRSNLQCDFSLAYVRAVASATGYCLQEASRSFDSDGVDVTVMARGFRGIVRSPRLDIQVKSWAGNVMEDPFLYDLAIKNYDELRDGNFQVPRILVVVVVPRDVTEWLDQTEQELVLRRCGYWLNLVDQPPVDNKSTVRVRIPRQNLFGVASLTTLMDTVAKGGMP